jgi:hypothetical protein
MIVACSTYIQHSTLPYGHVATGWCSCYKTVHLPTTVVLAYYTVLKYIPMYNTVHFPMTVVHTYYIVLKYIPTHNTVHLPYYTVLKYSTLPYDSSTYILHRTLIQHLLLKLDQAKLVQQLFKMTLVRLFYSYKTLIWLICCLICQNYPMQIF